MENLDMLNKQCRCSDCFGIYNKVTLKGKIYCSVCFDTIDRYHLTKAKNRITATGTKQDFFKTKCQVTNCLGNYIEISCYDDIGGVLHCDKCNHQIQRYSIKITKSPTCASADNYNYQAPVQTDLYTWSVFVRKFINNKCTSVIEHKFSDRESAETFSKNNWNLGEYF